MASQKTVSVLDQLKLDVLDMQQRSLRAEGLLNAPPDEGLPPSLRNDLAQLHGDANKILATRIDAILTGDLMSGKDDARSMRKQLIRDVEALIEKVEQQVVRCDRIREASK